MRHKVLSQCEYKNRVKPSDNNTSKMTTNNSAINSKRMYSRH